MFASRKLLGIGALGIAGLALVGAGAGATFTDSVHASQSVKAGTLRLAIAPINNDGSNVDDHNLTLNNIGPLDSTFSTPPMGFQVNNVGDVTAHTFQVSLAETDNDANLQNVYVKVTSHNPTASAPGNTPDTLYDGPISGLVGHPLSVAGDLTPAGTATDFDACEIAFYTPPGFSLGNTDEGHTITPTLTVSYQD